MKKFIKFVLFIFTTIMLSGCAIHEDFAYDGYYTTSHYVYYDMSPYHHHHVIVKSNKHNRKIHKDAVHHHHHKPHFESGKHHDNGRRQINKPINNRRQPQRTPKSGDRNGRYKR